MWYRISQNDQNTKPGWQDEMEFKSGLSSVNKLKLEIEKAIDKLSPSLKQEYVENFERILSNNSSYVGYSNSNLFEPLQKFYSNIIDQVSKQEIEANNLIKNIALNKYTNIRGYDQDKIFKEYLNTQNLDNIISGIGLGEDLIEIAKFFISYSTNPKFAVVSNILKKIPTSKWSNDVISLILNFYINEKLRELINQLQARKPFTFKEEVAISLINSKIATNNIKIGINLNNILNKNPLGQLIGNVGGVAAYGLDQLQSMMGTDKKIKNLVTGE